MKKEKNILTFEYENEIKAQGYINVCGIDEAGRGPLIGNVVAACVIFPDGVYVDGIDDSKKLSEKKREEIYSELITKVIYGVGMASPQEIDEINILNATMLAMNRAIENIKVKPDFALIDGNCSRGIIIPNKTVVKGDSKVLSIAAASIIAKVTRDHQCIELDKLYPEYGILKHKGYSTKYHMDMLRKYGPCKEHRKTFLKFLDTQEER